jgi:PDZ domain-containing protein
MSVDPGGSMQQAAPFVKNNSRSERFQRIGFGLTWLIVLPVAVWEIATYYIPLFAGGLNQVETWTVTAIIVLLVGVSLACHVLAHLWLARATGRKPPSTMNVLVFGDAAQRWPAAASPWREAASAGAGPAANLLLAGLAYLLWSLATNSIFNLIVLFVCGFNAWLFIINLIPAFPLDGGRLVRATLRGLVKEPATGTRLLRVFGFVLAAALAGWGIFLIAQRSRFSWETGAITFLLALLIVDGGRLRPTPTEDETVQTARNNKLRFLRALGAGLLTLVLSGLAFSLLLINNGLDAPGVALSVAPMVQVPAQYRHPHSGEFFLLTVISQAPITAGEWLVGQVDPAIQIVPPEAVTPKNTTPQQQAKQDFQMLDTSETTAIAVGLRLAGYSTVLVGKGVQVDAILPDSHANGLLQVGDVITGMNGTRVQTAEDLINLVGAKKTQALVHMQVKRRQAVLQIDVPLLPPASPDAGPKIGIQIQTAGFDYRPPFPVSITPNKISGGPSAGLMFTLTVYNSLIPEDLTGGRKIAGTGTINLDGSVGPIGGVKQKVFAAEAVGATFFLCPVDNYKDAFSVARHIQVVEVSTVQQAVDFLRSLPAQ